MNRGKLCEFCLKGSAAWVYSYAEERDWYACSVCSSLIDNNDRKALIERGLACYEFTGIKDRAGELVKYSLDYFFKKRTGPKRRY